MSSRYVIVSLGSIGRRHLANLRALRPESQIAVCRLSGAGREEPLPADCDLAFHSVDEAIRFAPTAAIIAGPASTHVEIAIALARSGIHLLIEKPLSDCLDQANDLLKTVDRSEVVAMVGYNLRFMLGLRAAKQLIDEGRIGTVLSVRAAVGQYLPDWRPDQDYRDTVSAQSDLGGGALLELSHEIDYLAWMFGVPDSIVARGGRFSDLEIDVEDVVEIAMKYSSPDKLVSIHLDLLDRAGFRELRVIGSDGTLCWDAMQDKVAVFEAGTREWQTIDSAELTDGNDVYLSEMQHFLACAENGSTPEVDIQQGCDVLRIICAARSSMSHGRSITIEKPNQDRISCSSPTDQKN